MFVVNVFTLPTLASKQLVAIEPKDARPVAERFFLFSDNEKRWEADIDRRGFWKKLKNKAKAVFSFGRNRTLAAAHTAGHGQHQHGEDPVALQTVQGSGAFAPYRPPYYNQAAAKSSNLGVDQPKRPRSLTFEH